MMHQPLNHNEAEERAYLALVTKKIPSALLLVFFGVEGGQLPYATADCGYDPTGSVKSTAEQFSTADREENQVLAQMATTALDVLSARSDRIWLMV